MKFKVGDKVKIRKNVTLEEIANNWFNGNGCQRDTFIFLKDYFYIPSFDTTFTIRDIAFDNAVKISTDSNWVNGVIFEKVEEILDDKEKEYLKAVIKPFRDRINYISLKNSYDNDDVYIIVHLEYNDSMTLPNFKKETMYKNMKLNKRYTLKELGLDE